MSLRKPSVKADPFLTLFHYSRSDDTFNNSFVEKIEFPLYKNILVLVNAFLCLRTIDHLQKDCNVRGGGGREEGCRFVEN